MRSFDRQLLRRVSASFGARPALVHPALMYALFMPFWKRQAAVTRVTDHARFERIRPDAAPRDCRRSGRLRRRPVLLQRLLPGDRANRAFVTGVVASLAERTHVVMLNPDSARMITPTIRRRGAPHPSGGHERQSPREPRLAERHHRGARAFIGTTAASPTWRRSAA